MSQNVFRFRLIPYLTDKLLSTIYRFIRRHFIVWRWVAQNYNSFFDFIAYINACSICHWSSNNVPAYKEFLQRNNVKPRYFDLNLKEYPETGKENYCKAFSIDSRAKHGRIVLKGSMLDESSGSTGVPFNWIRSKEELSDIHTFSANYARMMLKTDNLITLNAFSLGSWATGINTTFSLLKIGAVKSIGPDIEKILDTLKKYGTKYDYLVCGYPPFVKHLCDAMEEQQFPWQNYTMSAIVGGEGMTEALRDYIGKKFKDVRSGYGATDLQLGIGGESTFTIWLRKEILNNSKLKEAVLGKVDSRLPMIFQYNPLDHYIETNEKDEIVVTINNFALMCPRVRYNIEDEGKLLSMNQIQSILESNGYSWSELKSKFTYDYVQLPLLFIYGRKDGTISYMGANIYPQDIENGLYSTNYAGLINSFCISLHERKDLEIRPAVHVEVKERAVVTEHEEKEILESFKNGILEYLSKVDRDFAQARKEDSTTSDIKISLEKFGEGVFEKKDAKRIKNKYILEA